MSANAASLSCPVCTLAGAFNSVESLKDRLICVSTNNILCPVCQEEVLGLDKLTIHLFSHVKISNCIENLKTCESINSESSLKSKEVMKSQYKKSKTSALNSKNKPPPTNTPIKFVKIYPKLPVVNLNTSQSHGESGTNKSIQNNNNSVFLSTIKTEVSVLQRNLCNICGLQFADEKILMMHKSLIHNIDETTKNNFTRYNCHLCPKNFKMRGSLMVHLRVAHLGFSGRNKNGEKNKEKISSLQSQDQIDGKSSTLERNDNKQWQCDVCRKSFTTKYFLKKHKRLHTGETPYSCSQCNKTFTFQQSYHKHLLYHNDDKPHICTFCGRAFKELSTLHNHQRIHTGEKPFSCETCGKCFRQRVSYLVHRRIHTGVMPYKCTACNKSFRYKVSQRTHKCLAQPPGTVVRQNCEDLVEKLKKNKQENSDESLKNQTHDMVLSSQTSCFAQVSEANAELVRKGSKLSLEDMESENFNLIPDIFLDNNNCKPNNSQSIMVTEIGKDLSSESNNLINSIPEDDESVPSPTEILKNLCLSKEEDFTNILEIQNNDKYQLDLE